MFPSLSLSLRVLSTEKAILKQSVVTYVAEIHFVYVNPFFLFSRIQAICLYVHFPFPSFTCTRIRRGLERRPLSGIKSLTYGVDRYCIL